MKTFWMMSVVAFGLTALPASAQQPNERKAGDAPGPIDSLDDLQDTGRMFFKMADENNDGQISQKEAIDAGNLAVGGFFFRADQNGDGVLSPEEEKQARDSFLATKPWLRYAIETAKATPPVAGQPAATSNPNPLAVLATSLDTNNDKQLQSSELRSAVQSAVQGVFATADTNRDGNLSTTEVNAGLSGAARAIAQATFQQADTDNNGSISQAEFEKAVVQPTRTAFAIMDLNHDGQISQQEAQTARQVVMTKLMQLNVPEAPNSPRNQINAALGSQTQPTGTQPPAATAPR
jgi:Ca2+-binding EF-hand superfamily protein